VKLSLRIFSAFLLVAQLSTPAFPSQNTQSSASENAAPANLDSACTQPCLEDGTPVRLRISETVSSHDAHVNDRVQFEVLDQVKVDGVTVIPQGGIAWGTVTEAQPKRRLGRGGKLEIVMDSVRLTDGEKAPLRATKEAKGGGHTGAMTAGIVATGLIFFPAAPFFLFMHGKDITIPKGTEVPTFVAGNFHLDLARFQPSASANGVPATSPVASAANAAITVSSTPPGADISLDGAFVGDTPSTLTVPAGEHAITVTKAGYTAWERKMRVMGGKIDISAVLQLNQTN
jgi:hypothetical protein